MRLFGVYRGVVTDSNDPSGMGRVKVDMRGVQSGPGSGGWALVCLPAAAGHFAKAQTGATVIVAFEGGDPAYPIVLGRVASVGAAASPSPR